MKPTRHPHLLQLIEETRPHVAHYGLTLNDNQLLAAAALAAIRRGFHHILKLKACGPFGVAASFYISPSTYDDDMLTRIVLIAHQMGVRIEIGPSGPGLIKLMAHARITGDNKHELDFSERHPSLDALAQRCHAMKLPEITTL